MNSCLCLRLYRMGAPTSTKEYAFSGSLCCIREFEIMDGSRYCITVFSVSDYKQLHFPHEEYNILTSKLRALQSPQSVMPTTNTSAGQKSLTIQQPSTFDGDFKIKLGHFNLTIGPVTSFGILKTSPFDDAAVANQKHFTCDSKWDICTCKSCPIFKRLIDYKANAKKKFMNRKTESIVF